MLHAFAAPPLQVKLGKKKRKLNLDNVPRQDDDGGPSIKHP